MNEFHFAVSIGGNNGARHNRCGTGVFFPDVPQSCECHCVAISPLDIVRLLFALRCLLPFIEAAGRDDAVRPVQHVAKVWLYGEGFRARIDWPDFRHCLCPVRDNSPVCQRERKLALVSQESYNIGIGGNVVVC